MDKKIPVGIEFFSKLRQGNCYYVDKTEMIYDLAADKRNDVSLFTRPRRFGKTLTMSMLECFFSNQRKTEDIKALFSGLNIEKNHPEFCEQWMGQYPTLFITLKDVEGDTFESAYAMLRSVISGLCIKYAFLENDKRVNPADAEIFNRLMFDELCRSKEEKEQRLKEIKNSLLMIMRMMYAVYGKPVILLIDEYDVPLQKAFVKGFYKEMLDVIRGIMSTSLKTNEFLQFAVVTGCLRIPKESIFTGVNNFASYSVMDEEFADSFGFTETEMISMLEYYHLTDKMSLVREWYDGYHFGEWDIYCPWDAVNYLSLLTKNPDAKPKSFWENSSDNEAVLKLFDLKESKIPRQLEALMNGRAISATVSNALTYNDLYKNAVNLWSLLLMTGYLTVAATPLIIEQNQSIADLRIPNKEIMSLFQSAVVDHFKKTVSEQKVEMLMKALWDKDEDKASEVLSDLLFRTISYLNYNEAFYQGFMAGVFNDRGYNTRTEREQGLGRSDVIVKPTVGLPDYDQRRGLICEAKVSESKENMDYWCDVAIKQIKDLRYAEDPDFEGCKELLCYGIAFCKKAAKVKLMRR